MTYIVTYSRAHIETSEIGRYDDLADAIAAAIRAGADADAANAVTDRDIPREGLALDVAGHEGDDDYAIWIERA